MEIAIIKAVSAELRHALTGLKLVEAGEGAGGEVFLTFKGAGNKYTLLINPRPGLPRAHLVSSRPPAAREPDPFTQSLRNHIASSELVSLTQAGFERVMTFNFSRKGVTSALVFEMTGKKPGLILLDEAGKIIIAQSYVSISDSAQRAILPGLTYQPPPMPRKLDPSTLTEADIEDILRKSPGVPVEKALFANIGGISPLIAAEVLAEVGYPPAPGKIVSSLRALLERVENGPYEPHIYDTPHGPVLAAFPLSMYKDVPSNRLASMSEAAESYYSEAIERQAAASLKTSLIREGRTKLEAAGRKLSAIESDIAKSDKADEYQLMGQILMASLHSVPADSESVTLPNLFSEGAWPVTIPLDPKLGPVQNAEAYFRKAKKAKAGAAILKERLAGAQEELKRRKALIEKIEAAGGLDELRALSGRPSPKSTKLKVSRKSGELPVFPSFRSQDGYEVLYAKNARLNDILTFKVAEPMDLWLHAQGYHGAHVIVRNPERRPDIPLATILEAAGVAAYFSDARKDSSVAVDYAFKKYVRKPKKPAPGQAIFTNNKTVFVEPKKR